MEVKVLKGNKIKSWVNSLSFNFDKEYIVEIKRYYPKRSTGANKLYMMWMKALGNYLGYTKDEMHEVCKREFLDWEYKKIPGFGEYYLPGSTADENSKEFMEYLNQIHLKVIEKFSFVLPYPDDPDFEVFRSQYGKINKGENYV